MRGALFVALVLAVGCGPDFDGLFTDAAADGGAEGAVDAGAIDSGTHDASVMDGGADDDAGPPLRSCSPTPTCADGHCTYVCESDCDCGQRAACAGNGTEECIATCARNSKCDVTCKPTEPFGERTCTFEAHGAQSAAFTCGQDVDKCAATCDQGASCSLACNPERQSCTLDCANGAACAIHCNGTANCTLNCAPTAPRLFCLALNGVMTQTCNRSCP